MKSNLTSYKNCGSFIFDFLKPYKEVCNAPNNCGGIYLIYKIDNSNETLLYIGSSGRRTKDGKLKIRNGGIHDRLINGYHPNKFGEDKRIKRLVAFPNQMRKENISKIKIYWWVTHNGSSLEFPTDVERKLRNLYLLENKKLPSWHQQK